MFRTADMGLIVWDQENDDYSKVDLQANWQTLNDHDHTPGKGKPLTAASFAAGSITQSLLAPNSVGEAQIQDNAIDTDDLQDACVTAPKLAPGAASAAISPGSITRNLLDPNLLPLGTVWLWWRPSGSSTLPAGGWEIMDGRPWNTITNLLGPGATALTTGNIPDMRGAFPQGADPAGSAGPGIGVAGGSNTLDLSHTHTITPHTHGLASHTHLILQDGEHTHGWIGGFSIGARRNSFVGGITIDDHSGTQRHNTYWSLYMENMESSQFIISAASTFGNNPVSFLQDVGLPMDEMGGHNHTGATGGGSGPTDPNTPLQTGGGIGSTSVVPKNVGLLYIMLVR